MDWKLKNSCENTWISRTKAFYQNLKIRYHVQGEGKNTWHTGFVFLTSDKIRNISHKNHHIYVHIDLYYNSKIL